MSEELREAIASELGTGYVDGYGDLDREAAADGILALPELAALIADADNWRRATTGDPTEPEPLAMQARELLLRVRELEATVARVRGLAEDLDARGVRHSVLEYAEVAADLRRALDGDQ